MREPTMVVNWLMVVTALCAVVAAVIAVVAIRRGKRSARGFDVLPPKDDPTRGGRA